MPRIQLTITIDMDRPLGPQVGPCRAHGIPWKILERMTGFSRRGLSKMLVSSQLWERQVLSICVLNPAVAREHPDSPVAAGVSSLSLDPAPVAGSLSGQA